MAGWLSDLTFEPMEANASRGGCDDSFYHATSYASLAGIAEAGLQPSRGGSLFRHGGYAGHSQGRVFLACGRDAALAWLGKVQDQLWDQHQDSGDPAAVVPVLLQVSLPKGSRAEVDPVGDRDVPGSYYVERPIPASMVAMWNPSESEWIMVEDYGFTSPEEGVANTLYYNDEGDEVDEGDDWSSQGFDVYGPYDPGGFKPDMDDQDAWE